MEKRSIIIYMDEICNIGGIETWIYNLTSILKDDFRVQVVYGVADYAQLMRLQVPYTRYVSGGRYNCDILLNMMNGRPTAIRARHVVQMVHANYSLLKRFKYNHWDLTDSFIFVSNTAQRLFPYNLTGFQQAVLANPIAPPPNISRTYHGDRLRIMAATRLSSEKGGGRIATLLKRLYDDGLKFRIDIWSNWSKERFCEEHSIGAESQFLCLHPPKLDLQREMVDSDWVCQLSDCESFCYTIHEALSLKVPVLVTDWDGVRQIVKDGENGYILNMDMSNLESAKLLSPPTNFGSLPNDNQKWINYLNELPLLHDNKRMYNYFLNK